MGSYHARLSPSGAYRWTECTASPGASDGLPNEGTEAARVGTVCHQIQEECLLDPSRDLMSYLGRVLDFYADGPEVWRDDPTPRCDNKLQHSVEVTEEMLDAVASALAFITEQVELLGGHLLVEQRVPIGQFTGEEGATGSADVIIL